MDRWSIKSIFISIALHKLKALYRYYLWIPVKIPWSMIVFFFYRFKNLREATGPAHLDRKFQTQN